MASPLTPSPGKTVGNTVFFFSSRRRHTRCSRDWSSDVCSSDLRSFQPAQASATGSAPVSVAVGDFNGDGKLDLATANSGGYDVSVLLGNGDGTFRSEERRVGEEGRSPWSPYHLKKKKPYIMRCQ